MTTRRELLKGLMLAGGFCLLPLGHSGWVLAAPEPANRHLVVILMRGAVDGLSIVAPYHEQNYYRARPDIALAMPGQGDGLIDLDGFFGLHPALTQLMPVWQNKTLAFIHASGSPADTRSHFEAQDIMETALLNSAMANEGWMNGLAQILPDNHAPTRVLSYGNVLPKIFQGSFNVATVPTSMNAGTALRPENPKLTQEFAQLYGAQTQLGAIYQQGTAAREGMAQDLQPDMSPSMAKEMADSAKGAPNTDAFVQQSAKAGAMIRRDPHIQLVFMDVGGWDTHVGQGNAKGQLANKLGKLGDGLAALIQSMGDEYRNTTILVMSEFGRTVAQNGSSGTDHGHGNVAWLMGGGVRGGKVYSRWPGLNTNQLWQGRDLAVTTDFRSVIGMTVAGTFGVDDQTMQRVIPSYAADSGLRGIVT
jgi:uncharacterized protein (DUF1501 family)